VGASVAIFGIVAAVVVALYRHQKLFYLRDKRIGFVLLVWAAYQIFSGLLSPYIDNYGHLRGFAGGATAAWLLKPSLLSERSTGQIEIMATTATAPERKVSAAEAREVAEAAREQEWAAPSFVRDLFLGKFRLDLIHPYPEQDPEEVRRAQPFLEKLERLLREQVDSDRIDREGEIPDAVIQGLR